MRFVPDRVGIALCGAVAIGLGIVSMAGARSAPPQLPDPVILDRVVSVPAAGRPPKPADPAVAEPIRPCVGDDWDDDGHGSDSADSPHSADSMDCDCDDWDDWDDCG